MLRALAAAFLLLCLFAGIPWLPPPLPGIAWALLKAGLIAVAAYAAFVALAMRPPR